MDTHRTRPHDTTRAHTLTHTGRKCETDNLGCRPHAARSERQLCSALSPDASLAAQHVHELTRHNSALHASHTCQLPRHASALRLSSNYGLPTTLTQLSALTPGARHRVVN